MRMMGRRVVRERRFEGRMDTAAVVKAEFDGQHVFG
jgi:hypothetical protein